MRDKSNDTNLDKESGGVAAGFDFSTDIEDEVTEIQENSSIKPEKPQQKKKSSAKKAEIDPNRNYSPYYTPKPKVGAKGRALGRGAVDATERKVQFSLTCTPAQKDLFTEAAKKERRKLPEFICLAVEEYIENHKL